MFTKKAPNFKVTYLSQTLQVTHTIHTIITEELHITDNHRSSYTMFKNITYQLEYEQNIPVLHSKD